MHYNVKELSSLDTYRYLTNLIAPRPIALVSTIGRNGNVNLSPFSFFNLFSSNPPVVIFSPLNRVRDNTKKHTLKNILEVSDVVINIVTKDIIGQTSLASCEYEEGVDEFIKAGFTKEDAVMVKPPMVMEAKAKLECHVTEIRPLGKEGGAGTLVICEVLYMHIDDTLYYEDGKFDPHKLNLAARLGGDFYSEVNSSNLFTLPKPNKIGIGMDALPDFIKCSNYLTGNELAALAGVEQMPEYHPGFDDEKLQAINIYLKDDRKKEILHNYIKELIHQNKISHAWQVILNSHNDLKTQRSANEFFASWRLYG
jgi:flavin reductase (DIM6/NTAB) family NADH-FMN oxidoreductase RutF